MASNPEVCQAAKDSIDKYGFSLASAPLMCGCQDVHRQLELELAKFAGAESAIIYPSGYHCNIGVYMACFNDQDVIFSDQFNHASIIDGLRLTKSKRYVFKHRDYDMLEKMLKMASGARFRVIVTEGVFSMDADFCDLERLIALKKKYDAVLIVDDCHGLGVIGENGGGVVEYQKQSMEDIDIFVSTIGKALGGSTGGFVAGKKEIINWLRQRSRAFVFSNALPPMNMAGTLKAIELLRGKHKDTFKSLKAKTNYFRDRMHEEGFEIMGNRDCPICPVLTKCEKITRAVEMKLWEHNLYTIAVAFPIVSLGEARFRIIVNNGHS